MARSVPQSRLFNGWAGSPTLEALALGIKAVDAGVLAFVQVNVAQTVGLVHRKLHLMIVCVRRREVAWERARVLSPGPRKGASIKVDG